MSGQPSLRELHMLCVPHALGTPWGKVSALLLGTRGGLRDWFLKAGSPDGGELGPGVLGVP